ncbi:MAG: hypothetical protein ABI609_02060 [Acidobacteriota bacterium]
MEGTLRARRRSSGFLPILKWGLLAAIVALGARRVVIQSRALIGGPYPAAGDFRSRYIETQAWFDGDDVYRLAGADYPPATYVVLWPFTRPWSLPAARAVWCLTSLLSTAALSLLFATALAPGVARTMASILPWVASPTAIAMGVGQLGLSIVAAALGAVLLCRRAPSPMSLSIASLLLVFALVKPSVGAPLALATLATPTGWVVAGLGTTLYAAATGFACHLQPTSLSACVTDWARNGLVWVNTGYGNAATWAYRFGRSDWVLPLAALILLAAVAWLWSARAADAWTQIGVLACVARLWTYHYVADDVLIYLPMVALLRQVTRMPAGERWPWSAPLVAAALVLLLPTRWRDQGAWPVLGPAANTFALLGLLAALVLLERRGRSAAHQTVAL